ncbi:MAG: C39 family peptidase [Lachnospiraceae bacterium]|nr:C39 family peptidase [Lachnospiraceae bacterium]
MSNFSKNITRLLTFIIALLLAYLIFVVGIIGNLNKSGKREQDKMLDAATSVDATLLDESCLDADNNEQATPDDAELEEQATDTDAKESTPLDAQVEEEKALPSKVSLDIELIIQYPELPTGCESVALTMLLNYYGFDLEKTTIAKDYLIYSTNFVEGYMGNPFTTGGAGIYSPGLTRTANKFLDAQGSELNAKNVTDSTPEELYRYLAEGKPVVIWNTVFFLNNQPTGLTVKWGEKSYVWDSCEHCMVLSGYDLERNVVIVHDPIEGIVERDAEGFWQRYEKLGSMALIIR